MMGNWKPSEEQWNEPKLRELFAQSRDVIIHNFRLGDNIASEIVLIYNDGLCDVDKIGDTVLPELEVMYDQNKFPEIQENKYYGILPITPIESLASAEEIAERVFEGDLLLLFNESQSLFRMHIPKRPQRTPEESSTEVTIKGPKDGFVEDISVNVALIRKRFRSQTLCYEQSILGRRTKTKVGLLYVQDILSPKLLREVKKRLKSIDVDGVYSIEHLKEMIVDNKYSLFPLLDFTGRPDKVVFSLLAGRFVILIDGNPLALIGPSTLSLLLKSPEDIDFSFYYVSFTRILRGISLIIAIFLPGLWVALTAFHQEQIPFRLLATIASTRLGLPFPPQLELFILLVLLEILREAGFRIPSNMGSTLTIVGGLIIGDASIRAGLVSPSVVVVGAITAVSGITLVNQSLTASISLVRIVIFLLSCFLGIIGLLLGTMLLVFYMSSLRSFGIPFLSPISPLNKDVWVAVFSFPWNKMRKRPKALHTQDSDHFQGDDSSEERNH